MGEPIRRRSLIDDARFDTYTNIGLHKMGVQNKMGGSVGELSEEEDEEKTRWTCVVTLHDPWSIGKVIRELEVCAICM